MYAATIYLCEGHLQVDVLRFMSLLRIYVKDIFKKLSHRLQGKIVKTMIHNV